MTIEERVTQLERKNRRLTLALVSVGMAAILTVAMGQAAREAVPEIVTAHQFNVVDGDGKLRASLGTGKDGTSLGLLDENGKPRVAMGADRSGSRVNFMDEHGQIWRTLP